MSRTELTIVANALDNASDVLKKLATNTEGAMTEISKSTNKVNVSMKDVATSVSGVATSAYGMYLSLDRVMDMSIQVDKANLLVRSSTQSLADAQSKYNATVEKYGEDSPEATKAAEELAIAQERLSVNTERASMVQENQMQAMGSFALMIVPQAITMVTGLTKTVDLLKTSQIAQRIAQTLGIATTTADATATTADAVAKTGATVATSQLSIAQRILNSVMKANPILLVVSLIGMLVGALIIAYETCEPFRNAVNMVGEALKNIFGGAVEWVIGALTNLWNNVLVPVGNALKWLWEVVTSNPLLSALFGPITLLAYIFTHWEEVTKSLTDTWNNFVGWVQGGVDILTGIFNTLKGVWDATVGKIAEGIGWVGSQISGFAGALAGAGATGMAATTGASATAGAMPPITPAETTQIQNNLISQSVIMKQATVTEEDMMDALSSMAIPRFAKGGQMPRSGLAILEAGERVLPPNTLPVELTRNYKIDQSQQVNINSPLVVIQGGQGAAGGGMREMGEIARRVVFDALRSVRIQQTSSGALTSSVSTYSTAITTTPMATPGSVGMVGASAQGVASTPTTVTSTSGSGSITTSGTTVGTSYNNPFQSVPYNRLLPMPY